MVFVNSMSDLFHEDVPDEFIDRVFETMRECDWHVFQVLTKRAERMQAYTSSRYNRRRGSRITGKRPWPQNVWLGVSVENNRYTERITELQKSPAVVRFLSLEPLLGPIELTDNLLAGVNWVIVGGESGPRARPMDPKWVVDIHLRCQQGGIPFFFKQWGAYDANGKRVGKKAAGRLLNGVTWDEMPHAGQRESGLAR
jgi:protein gp37